MKKLKIVKKQRGDKKFNVLRTRKVYQNDICTVAYQVAIVAESCDVMILQ